MERQYAHRVVCPVCGRWAQLRVAYSARHRRVVVFSCSNQTEASHPPPSRRELLDLIPDDAPLPELTATATCRGDGSHRIRASRRPP